MSIESTFDPAEALRRGSLPVGAPTEERPPHMTEMSIDGTLLLSSIGFEPVDFVYGIASHSFPFQVWHTGEQPGYISRPNGPVPKASQTLDMAFNEAREAVRRRAVAAGAIGVVDTRLGIRLDNHYVVVELLGTAIRPVEESAVKRPPPFVSDLSARDFVTLRRAGLTPLDFAAGYGFSAVAPRVVRNWAANRELVNLTRSMYDSREIAMERLQRSAGVQGAVGVVGVRTSEYRFRSASLQVVVFGATGTVVQRLEGSELTAPDLLLNLDDGFSRFDVRALNPSPDDNLDEISELILSPWMPRLSKTFVGSLPGVVRLIWLNASSAV